MVSIETLRTPHHVSIHVGSWMNGKTGGVNDLGDMLKFVKLLSDSPLLGFWTFNPFPWLSACLQMSLQVFYYQGKRKICLRSI